MEHGISEQLRYLCAVFFTGCLSGFLYDVLRAKRKLFKASRASVNIEDILFCVLCGGIILTVTFYFNSGEIRAGAFLWTVLGTLAYFLLLRNNMVKLLVKAANILESVIKFVLKIVLFPLKIIIRLFKKPVRIIFWYAGGKIRKSKSIFRVTCSKLRKKAVILNIFTRKR